MAKHFYLQLKNVSSEDQGTRNCLSAKMHKRDLRELFKGGPGEHQKILLSPPLNTFSSTM